jgi:hypothetical protein
MGKANVGTYTHFPLKQTIFPDMWKAAQLPQRMDDRTFLLSHVECDNDHQRAFKRTANEITTRGQEKTPLLEKAHLWYSMGDRMHSIGKISVFAIIVPTSEVIQSMERRGYALLEELRKALQPLILQYPQLTQKDLNDFHDGDAETLGPEYMLDVMDSFHRLTQIRQFGQSHWRCLCTRGFRHMACHHSTLISALWDPDVVNIVEWREHTVIGEGFSNFSNGYRNIGELEVWRSLERFGEYFGEK